MIKAFLALCAAYGLSGCATTRVDLLKQGTVKVEVTSDGGGTIMPVFVYQSSNTITIAGDIRNIPRSTHTGHISIEVIGPDGFSLAKTETHVSTERGGHNRGQATP